MRIFISFNLPKKIKSEVSKIQDYLKKTGLEAKWVKPENTHLTIAFLGSINPEQITVVKEIVNKVNQRLNPIKLTLSEISAFPNVSRARVIFVGLSGQIETLNKIAKEAQEELKRKNIWFDEKPFVAHLTLGRFKKPTNLTQFINKLNIKRVPLEVKNVSCYQSLPTPSGPIYTKLGYSNPTL